ncbi:hypothetical protein HDV02_005996 [Globomyces sp. JEL0801]|nr:hypothetical protein HDV02_005996 [Globomyces sp. JEL0801]
MAVRLLTKLFFITQQFSFGQDTGLIQSQLYKRLETSLNAAAKDPTNINQISQLIFDAMTKSKDEFRVVTDIAMYISLIITLYAFIPTFKNLLQFGFTRHLTKVFIFDLLLLTSQILAMTYRYASNIDAIRLLIAALYIINIMSLIFQLYVSEMFVLLAFAGYFNQRPIILYILVLIAFISTGSSMFFITVGFTNSFSQNIIDVTKNQISH